MEFSNEVLTRKTNFEFELEVKGPLSQLTSQMECIFIRNFISDVAAAMCLQSKINFNSPQTHICQSAHSGVLLLV
jgi:hypothetical protein